MAVLPMAALSCCVRWPWRLAAGKQDQLRCVVARRGVVAARSCESIVAQAAPANAYNVQHAFAAKGSLNYCYVFMVALLTEQHSAWSLGV